MTVLLDGQAYEYRTELGADLDPNKLRGLAADFIYAKLGELLERRQPAPASKVVGA